VVGRNPGLRSLGTRQRAKEVENRGGELQLGGWRWQWAQKL